jgi:hypothetical protein
MRYEFWVYAYTLYFPGLHACHAARLRSLSAVA